MIITKYVIEKEAINQCAKHWLVAPFVIKSSSQTTAAFNHPQTESGLSNTNPFTVRTIVTS